jgi:hypothetical protein
MIFSSLLLAVLAVGHPSQANSAADKLLGADKYAFCHDEDYPLTNNEAAWCPPVSPEKNPRCPAFHHVCNAPRAELEHLDRLSPNRGSSGSGSGDGDGKGTTSGEKSRTARRPGSGSGSGDPGSGDPGSGDADGPGKRKTPDRTVIPEDPSFDMPELGGFAYYLFWAVLAAGVLFLIYVIVRNSSRDKAETEAVAVPTSTEQDPLQPQGPSEQVVRDVNLLLEQARTAASAGDFTRAIRHTHAALLHRLDNDGLIRVAPFRTNGDYVSDLKPQPDLRSSVRDIVRDVEQVQFGTTQPDAGLFDRVFKRVVPIATRRGDTLALLLASSLLSCTCTALPKSYPYDLSPSGTRAVVELAAHHGRTLDFLEVPLDELPLDDKDRAIILLHDAVVDAETWQHLLAWAANGNHLVVAGAALPAELPVRYKSGAAGHVLKVSPAEQGDYSDLTLVVPDTAALDRSGMAGELLLTREDGQPYAIKLGRGYLGGDITVFADDRLFTNAALMLGDNPRFLATFLTELTPGPIDMVDSMLDMGSDSPGETISNTHLTAAILQLLALIVLLYLSRGVRFGAPRDPPSRSRRHYTEHIDAVGQHYARARASRHALRLYATWALDRLRDKTLTSRQPGLYALAQAVAGRTGDDEAKVMQILVESSGVRDDVDASMTAPSRARPPTLTDDLSLMQELARLVRLVGGPR